MPKKKLSDLDQTHGKLESDNLEITSLDQLFGETGFSKYKTLDLSEYENSLEELNSAELRRHAVEVAHVVPSTSVERLKKRLILEFKKHVAGYTVPKQTHKKEKLPSKEVLKIMAETK